MTRLSAWKMACVVFLFCAATAIAVAGQTFTKLRAFNETDGEYPVGYLIQGTDGNFYGTTESGGATGNGTIFKVTPEGRLTTAYSFCSQPNCADGANPTVGLILATDGSFYGTAAWGGDPTCIAPSGCGTVFRITPHGELTTLHVFKLTDGARPWGNLTEGADGSFYGTTSVGGDLTCNPELNADGCGTVFRITSAGSVTTLHAFDYNDGALPYAGLVQATDGNFYGVTEYGGPGNCNDGCGTVFKITPSGVLTTLYTFETEGEPDAPLVQASDGNFYSTTFSNTVFRITPMGDLATLYYFSGGGPFGVIPQGLTQATDGNLYGPTSYGGDESICNPPDGCGTLYELSLGGVLTNLHDFDPLTNGAGAQGGMLQSTTGVFYGVTSYGGKKTSECCGTVYSLDMGLGPFVTFVRFAGKVGQTGPILGQGFTGTTSVSLNGTSAAFTVVSDTFIKATVPVGATTGYVTVTTPSGTLTSNVPFHVLP
jgi:uncharacterized repeat protein (TIGR03803 family)